MSAVGSQSVSKRGTTDDAFSRRASHASISTLDVRTGRLQWRTALHGRGHHKIEYTLEASLRQMRPRRLGKATMSQHSSLTQSAHSVRQVLTAYSQQPDHTEAEEYRDHRNGILNGYPSKILFDCNRALQGDLFDEQEKDYRKARLYPVHKDTVGARYYYGVCMAVTRKVPYISD